LLRFRSLRFRIGAAFILGSLVVGTLIAGSTYALVRRQLTRERVGAAQNQTWSKLRQVVDYLETAPDPTVRSPDILQLIRERGPVIIVTEEPDGELHAQESDAKFRFRDLPIELVEAVDGGDVAYVLAGRRMVIGTRIPGAENSGQVYFEYRIGALVRTLNTLLRSLAAVVAASVLVAGAFGLRLASATIRPLRLAANAAREIAEGNLNTRLDVRGGDELGQLSTAFNQMTAALEERMARERRFVADVSHELRTPLTTLKTSMDFVAQRTDDLPEPLRKAVGLASREVR
jgi:two-component system, OmpR family, sensor histidine kinase MtrB